jgi:phage-related protein
VREIIYYRHFYEEFYNAQTEKVKDKIDYVLYIVENAERVPKKFLEHLEEADGLYEIRVKFGSNIFRIFCFFDKGKLVVLLNGFQKKSQKTPKQEIKLAERLKKEYFENK